MPILSLPAPSRLALGVEDRRIPDGAFSSSSSWNRNHGPKRSRLNIARQGRRTGAWSSRVNNRAQWLLIDITKMARVVGFAIQGRQDHNQWVMSVRISYSRDGIRFRYYTERRRPKVCSYILGLKIPVPSFFYGSSLQLSIESVGCCWKLLGVVGWSIKPKTGSNATNMLEPTILDIVDQRCLEHLHEPLVKL